MRCSINGERKPTLARKQSERRSSGVHTASVSPCNKTNSAEQIMTTTVQSENDSRELLRLRLKTRPFYNGECKGTAARLATGGGGKWALQIWIGRDGCRALQGAS